MNIDLLYEDAHSQVAFLAGYDDALLEARVEAAWWAVALAAPMRLRAVCGWCRVVLREGDPDAPLSHSICDACADRIVDDFKKGRAA